MSSRTLDMTKGNPLPLILRFALPLLLGNIFQQELSEILESPRAKDMAAGFRCRTATEELCRHCGYAQTHF